MTRGRASVRHAALAELAAGSVLAGRYQIEAAIGQGGSGTVFRAWDRVLGEPIAIKILQEERARERSWIRRLAREVKVARAIRHPNVCRVFDLGQADGRSFITMELATGGSLRDLLRGEGKAGRSLAERLEDARAICAGLAAIHAVGIIHRDVTPQNMLRMADGRLVLSDFGLAIEATANTTVHGGTPAYMPPETARGERADQRSDVWQLGAVLHEVLFDRRPGWAHDGDRTTMTWPIAGGAGPVEEELARLCRECLSQNPAARPPTAMAVAGRLAAAERARPRTGLERAWRAVSRALREHRNAATVVAALALVAGGVRVVQVASRPPDCRGGGERVAGVWDGRVKEAIRTAFARTGKSYAQETFGAVDRVVGRYLGAWLGMYQDACEATHVRGEQSAEVLDLRMDCLGDRLTGVRALSVVLSRADGAVVDGAVDAVGALPPLDRCADVRQLKAVLPPPDDRRARAAVERIRSGIAEGKAMHDAGKEKPAMDRLAGLVAEARRVGYGPALAEALFLLGQIETLIGDNERADRTLRDAFFEAEAARYDQVKGEAATVLVLVAGRRDRFREAEEWSRQADAVVRRIGGEAGLQSRLTDRLRAWLELHLGEVRRRQGRREEALSHGWRALRFNERAGASAGQLARTLNNVALILDDMGRAEEALRHIEKAITDLGEELGSAHPLIGTFISNRGEILAHLGRHREARAAFERAIAIEEPGYGAESTNLAYPLAGLGESLLSDREPAAAIAPLERALRIREAGETDSALIADSRFALARALWLADPPGRDRARARRLAAQAREVYAAAPHLESRVAVVDRWIKEDRRPAKPFATE